MVTVTQSVSGPVGQAATVYIRQHSIQYTVYSTYSKVESSQAEGSVDIMKIIMISKAMFFMISHRLSSEIYTIFL